MKKEAEKQKQMTMIRYKQEEMTEQRSIRDWREV